MISLTYVFTFLFLLASMAIGLAAKNTNTSVSNNNNNPNTSLTVSQQDLSNSNNNYEHLVNPFDPRLISEFISKLSPSLKSYEGYRDFSHTSSPSTTVLNKLAQ